MVRLVRGETVICQLNGERTYDRWVGTCFLDGQDVAAIDGTETTGDLAFIAAARAALAEGYTIFYNSWW